MTETITNMTVHPLARLFPPITGDEFQKLVKDIKDNGLINPVVRHEGRILDGRNRLLACDEAGVLRRYVEFASLGLACTPEDYIWSVNVQRRHLNDGQRAVLATQFADALNQAALSRQKAGLKRGKKLPPVGADSPPRNIHPTRKAIAERAQVSEHNAKQAQAVHTKAPELEPKVIAGALPLRDAVKIANQKSKDVPTKVRPRRGSRTKAEERDINKEAAEFAKALQNQPDPDKMEEFLESHKWQQALRLLESGDWVKRDAINVEYGMSADSVIQMLRKSHGCHIETRREWNGKTSTTYYRLPFRRAAEAGVSAGDLDRNSVLVLDCALQWLIERMEGYRSRLEEIYPTELSEETDAAIAAAEQELENQPPMPELED
jgi:hypothetical protein